MTPSSRSRKILYGTFCLVICLNISIALAGSVRTPVVAGMWYPDSRVDLEQMLDSLTRRAEKTTVTIPPRWKLKALILPHAGFAYSGWTAAHACKVLSPEQFRKVLLLGPDHRVGFQNGAVSNVTAYQTPLGLIPLHADAKKLRSKSELFRPVPESDRTEHSLEAVLPFLQYYLKEFSLVPIVLGPCNIPTIADALEPLIDNDTLLVVSSDLSHFLSYPQAKARDRETIRMILNFDSEKILHGENCACGKTPILVLIDLARRHGWQPVPLHYSNSGDTGGGRSRVVGYAAIAFFEGDDMAEKNMRDRLLTEKEGLKLVRLARRTIAERLGPIKKDVRLDEQLTDPCFQIHCGTFVTLKKNGRLRGCIGNLTSSKSVVEGVTNSAVNAAFHDPRFPPLAADELDRLQISVSVLTEPKLLFYKDSGDLISKLRVNVDGVILRKGAARATFLPQVWEQLPAPENFLSHLCAKAGLAPDSWRHTKLEISTYQVQYFEEQK